MNVVVMHAHSNIGMVEGSVCIAFTNCTMFDSLLLVACLFLESTGKVFLTIFVDL